MLLQYYLGVFVQSIGGSGNGVLEGPYGVAVDDENVVVTR